MIILKIIVVLISSLAVYTVRYNIMWNSWKSFLLWSVLYTLGFGVPFFMAGVYGVLGTLITTVILTKVRRSPKKVN